MGRNNVRGHIVRRMLDRRKGTDILTVRQNNDSSRVLPCRPAHPGTSLYNPINFTISLMDAPLFKIIFHIPERCLICQRSDRPRPERMSLSKDYLCIFVRITLIFSGKIKVNIRLLVSLESQKRLKRNIKAFFHQRFPADRTGSVRHIAACFPQLRVMLYLRRIKIAEMAFFAIIMRRQRIYLRNSGHRCHKRRSYRTTGAHQIPVFI